MSIKAILLAALASILALPGVAQDVSASQVIEKRVVTADEAGVETVDFVPVEVVAPGDTVRYRLHFRNAGTSSADAVTLVMPVPAETSFVSGSASTDRAAPTFSYDDGATFGTEAGPADERDPTHIRWVLDDAVAAGAEGDVSFLAVLD